MAAAIQGESRGGSTCQHNPGGRLGNRSPGAEHGRPLAREADGLWKIEQDYQQLKEELGLDHYEGRSWSGWHHHVTLVMLAHSFLTLETLRSKKNFWLDPAEDAP